jgi:hypothetical protein
MCANEAPLADAERTALYQQIEKPATNQKTAL